MQNPQATQQSQKSQQGNQSISTTGGQPNPEVRTSGGQQAPTQVHQIRARKETVTELFWL